jgi:hypothetical protein
VFLELILHLVEQRLVGELHAAAECEAQQLAAEVPYELVLASREQIIAQPSYTFKLCSVHELDFCVERVPAGIFVAQTSDPVELLQREPKRVDALVTDGTLGDLNVLLDHLPHGEAVAGLLIFGQDGHILRRLRQLLAEQRLDHPVAAQDWTGA